MGTQSHNGFGYVAIVISCWFIASYSYGHIRDNPEDFRMIYKGSGLESSSILVLGYGILGSEGVRVKRGEVLLQIFNQELSNCDTVQVDVHVDTILSEKFTQERQFQSKCMYRFEDPRIEVVEWQRELTRFAWQRLQPCEYYPYFSDALFVDGQRVAPEPDAECPEPPSEPHPMINWTEIGGNRTGGADISVRVCSDNSRPFVIRSASERPGREHLYSTTVYQILELDSTNNLKFSEALKIPHYFSENKVNDLIQCEETCTCHLSSWIERIGANHAANTTFVTQLLGEPSQSGFQETSDAIGKLVLDRDYSSDPIVSVERRGRLTRLNRIGDYELWIGEVPDEKKVRYIWLEATDGQNQSTWESGFGVPVPWRTYLGAENGKALPYALNCTDSQKCRFFDPATLRISTPFPVSVLEHSIRSVGGLQVYEVNTEFSWCPGFGSRKPCEQ